MRPKIAVAILAGAACACAGPRRASRLVGCRPAVGAEPVAVEAACGRADASVERGGESLWIYDPIARATEPNPSLLVLFSSGAVVHSRFGTSETAAEARRARRPAPPADTPAAAPPNGRESRWWSCSAGVGEDIGRVQEKCGRPDRVAFEGNDTVWVYDAVPFTLEELFWELAGLDPPAAQAYRFRDGRVESLALSPRSSGRRARPERGWEFDKSGRRKESDVPRRPGDGIIPKHGADWRVMPDGSLQVVPPDGGRGY